MEQDEDHEMMLNFQGVDALAGGYGRPGSPHIVFLKNLRMLSQSRRGHMREDEHDGPEEIFDAFRVSNEIQSALSRIGNGIFLSLFGDLPEEELTHELG